MTKLKIKQLEKDVQKDIMNYLETKGYIVVRFNNVGIFKKATGKYIPPRAKGIPDLFFFGDNFRAGCIEVKAPGKKKTATPEQLDFLARMKERGHIAILTDNLDEITRIL